MSIQINDGGPAFPVVFQHDEATSECYGISIRDYFAAAALEKASRGSDRNADEIAKRAFYIADAMLKAQAAFDEYSHDRSIEEIQKKLTDANQHVTELENRLRALWDKLEGERKYYMEHLQLNEELVSEIELENERLKEQNKRQNEAIDSLREMYAKDGKL